MGEQVFRGDEQLNFRLSSELKQATVGMREMTPMADILAAVYDVWKGTQPATGEEFLATVRGTLTATESNVALTERSKQIGARNRQLAQREKDVDAKEQESQSRLRQLELKAQTAAEKLRLVQTMETKAVAELNLSMVVIRELKASFRGGWRPADLLSLSQLARSLNLDPFKVADHFQKFGGIRQVVLALEEREKALTDRIQEHEAQVTKLRGEIETLRTRRDALVAEVGAALSTARTGFSTEVGAALTRLEESASMATARIEATARDISEFAASLPGMLAQELLEPYTRLLEMGVIVDGLDGSPDVDRLAVAARLLLTDIEQRGDVDLPKGAGEYGPLVKLSWAVQKIWALASTDPRPRQPASLADTGPSIAGKPDGEAE